MADYIISGLQPALTGEKWEQGESWFLFDESGTFSVNEDIKARIYLVGGGCGGGTGEGDSLKKIAKGGKGGDGGCVYITSSILIPKNTDCAITISGKGDVSGTTLDVSGTSFSCDDSGHISKSGGTGASVQHYNNNGGGYYTSGSSRGIDGVDTPYGYVGSSGGGGSASCSKFSERSTGGSGAGSGGSNSRGTSAVNYGCGGGGGSCYVDTQSTSMAKKYPGGEGKGGCVIVCVINNVEIPDAPNLTYNGLVQYPFGENGIKGVVITGDLNATAAGKYTSYLSLESDDLCWSDGTQREVEFDWEIKPLVVPKPTLSQYEYDYNGSVLYDKDLYKLPSIEWEYNGSDVSMSDIMAISGKGLEKQYKAGSYPIVFALIDPGSCSWDSGDVEDETLTWVINKIEVPYPEVVSEDFSYDRDYHSPIVEGYKPEIMTQDGHTGSYTDAGDYSIIYTLRDPDSCSWVGGDSSPKPVYWSIKKQVVYLEPPYLEDDQKNFTYNGDEHSPVISNYDGNYMAVSGTSSSIAANTADIPFWIIVVSLRKTSNYTYLWKVDDPEKQAANIELDWSVEKGRFSVPVVTPEHTKFTGDEHLAEISGYEPRVMTQQGQYYGTAAGEYTLTYVLKDKDSAVWDDGTVEDKSVSWFIDPVGVPVPKVTDTSKIVSYYSYNNYDTYLNTQSPDIEPYSQKLISVSGNSYSYPGSYEVVFRLIDPVSSYWDDENGGTDNRTVSWEIKREKITYKKFELDTSGMPIVYDGKDHKVDIKNIPNNSHYSMSWSGGFCYFKYYSQDVLESPDVDGRYYSRSKKAAREYEVVFKFIEPSPYDIFEVAWDDGTRDDFVLEWRIEKAQFKKPDIEKKVFKYDGTVHNILDTEKNYDEYVMSRSSDHPYSASAVGEYSVKYSLLDKESASWINDDRENDADDIVISWRITEADPIEPPVVTNLEFTYDGVEKFPDIGEYNDNIIKIDGKPAVDAGEYCITISLTDPNSAYWTDGSIAPKVVKWNINKAVKTFDKPVLDEKTTEYDYDGLGHSPTVLGVDDSVMEVDNPEVIKAGKHHTVTVSLKTHKNYEYQWSDGTSDPLELEWKINRSVIAIPAISQDLFYYGAYSLMPYGNGYITFYAWRYPEILGYNENIILGEGISQGYYVNEYSSHTPQFVNTSGKWYGNSQWSLGKYYVKFTLKDPDSCDWINGETKQKVDVDNITYEWSIVREIKLLEKPYLINDAFEYDGMEKTPIITNGDVSGVINDGDRSMTAAGSYTIKSKPQIPQKETDVYDYRWIDNSTDEIQLPWKITGGKAQIPTLKDGTAAFIYDGLGHIPIIENFDENKVLVDGYSEETELGQYTITFSLKDDLSCVWEDGSKGEKYAVWSITKQKFKKPTIKPAFMQYDGEAHTVEFIGNENDHSFVVSGFDDNTMRYGGDMVKTDVGNYEVVISLKDTNSAAWEDGTVEPVKLPWEIRKKTVLLDKPYLEPTIFIFNGEFHTPDIIGWKNYGMYIKDGSVRSAMFSGKYTITLCLAPDHNIDYLWGDAVENAVGGELPLSWEIKKATGEYGLDKPVVTDLEFPYDKNNHSPKISDYNKELIDIDGTTTAWQKGTYIITFLLKYPNDSTWKDGSVGKVEYTWHINKPKQPLTSEQMPYIEPETFVFDGLPHKPDVKNLIDILEVKSDIPQIDVGDYEVTVGFRYNADESLIDYTWSDGSVGNIALPWEIIPKNDILRPDIKPRSYPYDGLPHSPEPIDLDEDFVEYDGEKPRTAAGSYSVFFKLKHPKFTAWADGTGGKIDIGWEITKSKFEKPDVAGLEFVYDGELHAPVISGFNSNVMEITRESTLEGTSAGEYKIVFSLKDKNSAAWTDGTIDDVEYDWVIHKAEVEKPFIQNTQFTYNAGEHTPTVKNVDELVVKLNGDQIASDAGEYHIYADLKDTFNYQWKGGGSEQIDMPWVIHRRKVEKPHIDSAEFEYTGKTIYAPVLGFKETSMEYTGGIRSAEMVGDYTVIIRVKPNYEWDDGTTDNLALDWHIIKIIVKKPTVTGLKFKYDGAAHAPRIEIYNVDVVSVNGTLSSVDSGDYHITFSLNDKEHCQWNTFSSDDITVDWSIYKRVLPKPVVTTSHFVYNGGWHSPIITGLDEKYMRFKGTNKEVNAGHYTYEIILANKNCIYDDDTADKITVLWDIARKPVKVPYLEPARFEYDGKTHSPVIYNLNEDIMEITPYSSSVTSASDVGDYHISITIGKRIYTGDDGYTYLRNWEWETGGIDNIVLNWHIVSKTLNYPVVIKGRFVYDTFPHSPVIQGYITDIMDVIGTYSETDVGRYKLGFHLHDKKNYKWADGVIDGYQYDWEITRAILYKNLDIPRQKPILIYNGCYQTPEWENYDPSRLVFDGVTRGKNYGTYIAEFVPTDNYIWEDGSCDAVQAEWKIEKLGIKAPMQIEIPYYNGEVQMPKWDFEKRVDLSYAQNSAYRASRVASAYSIYDIVFTGETEGTNAGEYKVDCQCDDNCFFLSTGNNAVQSFWIINKAQLKKPVPKQKYPYTGEMITPEFDNYIERVLDISGAVAGIEIGDYTAYFDIRDKKNYEWAADVVVNRKLRKAPAAWQITASAKTAQIPYQNNWLIYNRENQSPRFENYDPSFLVLIGGIPSKINAGVYFVTFRLKFNVVWEDGTTEDKVVPWEIDKLKYPKPHIKTSTATGGMYYYEIEGKRYPIWENYVPEVMNMNGDTYDIDSSWHTTSFAFKDPSNYSWEDDRSDTYSIRWKLSEPYTPTRVPGSRDKKVHIPQQIKAPYADGTTKYPVWDRFDDTAILKIGGVWEGINADTYYVILNLRDGYFWEDDAVEIKAIPWKILAVGEPRPNEPAPIVIHIPEQINIPCYDGFVKEPEWDEWDKFGFDVVKGELYGVIAGTYHLTLRPKTGYIWEDGTVENKVVTWVIDPRQVDIPDDPVPGTPPPEKEETVDSGNCCNICCCDTGLFDKLNNCDCDDGAECDCTKDVEI